VSQSPILTVTTEAIQNAGTPTIDAALIQSPQFGVGSTANTNNQNGVLGAGQATLNLRQLGTQRTLVLFDGRRAQPGNADQTIDINTFPALALTGVETITGGASATYGSDAIAGVVNFKLRHSYDGLRLSGQQAISSRGDAPTTQLGLLAGTDFADGRGHIVVAGEYAYRAPILATDRPFFYPSTVLTVATPSGQAVIGGSQAETDRIFGTYGYAAGTVNRNTFIGINRDNTLFDAVTGTNYKPYGEPCVYKLGNVFGHDNLCTTDIQTRLERYSGYLRAEYEASSNVKLYAQGLFARSESLLTSSYTGVPQVVPMSNPFIPADLRALLISRGPTGATAPFSLLKRTDWDGLRQFSVAIDTWQGLAGATGNIGLGDWTFDVFASTGRTHEIDKVLHGAFAVDALNRLVNAADGGASICAGGVDLFGAKPISAACFDYLHRIPVTKTDIRQQEVAGTISGSLFKLPGGDAKLAVTANYRHTKYTVSPDPDMLPRGVQGTSNFGLVNGIPPTSGTINVKEIAGELLLPVLAGLPFVESLNISAGYRYSDYNLSGGVSAWKVGADWRVFEPLLLRGGYQKAVRAPNIGELFLASSSRAGSLAGVGGDPCLTGSRFRTGANAAQVRALCVAQGIANPDAYTTTPGANTVVLVVSGNPTLRPEKATTYSFGGVFRPTMLGEAFRSMSLSVDYYNIKLAGAVGELSVTDIFNKCFNGDGSNPTYSQSNQYCSAITPRQADGSLNTVLIQKLNLGSMQTSGIDMAFDWTVPLGSNSNTLALNLAANRLLSFDIQNLPGGVTLDYSGTIATSSAAYPKWKINGSLTWDIGAFQVGARWRHLSSFTDACLLTNPSCTNPAVKGADYFDLFSRIRVADSYELRLGVTNVGDRKPSQVGPNPTVTDRSVFDIVGRSFYAAVEAKF